MRPRGTSARIAGILAVAVWLVAGYLAARKFLPPHPRTTAARITSADVNEVIANIQIIRQLKFKHPVNYRFLTTDQALEIIREDEKRHGEEAKDRLAARVGIMLGLLPPGTDPEVASMRAPSMLLVPE